ncbi:MAG: sulfatase-like hydrolase/transferase, partial [Acidaminobacteraceae bacterium]
MFAILKKIKERLNKEDLSVMLFVLLLLKLMVVYSEYDFYALKTIAMTLVFSVTLIFISLMFFSYISSKHRVGVYLYFFFYIVVSLLMLITTMYLGYFGEYPSLQLANQFSQASAIMGSVREFTKLKYILFVIDIPFVLYFAMKGNKLFSNTCRFKSKKLIMIMSLILLVNIVSVKSYGVSLSKTEFFSHWLNETIVYSMGSENMIANANVMFDVEGQARDTIDKLKVELKDKNVNIEFNSDDKYFGIGKGMNLLVIQLESFENFPIGIEYKGKEVTPIMNALIKEKSLYFPNYFQQIGRGNTSDAEFATNNSLYPAIHGKSYNLYEEKVFKGLPWILRELGYTSTAAHGYVGEFWNRTEAYPAQGFEKFRFEDSYDISDKIGFGLSDESFYKQEMENIKNQEGLNYNFLISLSNHHPYDMPDRANKLGILDSNSNFLDKYMTSINYTDYAVGQLIQSLKDEGLYDNTIIAMYGDHQGIITREESADDISKLLGRKYNYEDMMNIPLIIHIPTLEASEKIENYGGQLDFTPTMLNLLGIDDRGLLLYGKDIVNNSDEIVEIQTHMSRGSYISKDVVFSMSNDGVIENAKSWIPFSDDVYIPLTEEMKAKYESSYKDIVTNDYIIGENMLSELYEREEKVVTILDNKIVAKGGGKTAGINEFNAYESFNKTYNSGGRFFNIQVMLTNDGFPVLIKDWSLSSVSNLTKTEALVLSKDEYDLSFMKFGLTKFSVLSYNNWLSYFDDVSTIVTS